MLNVVVADESNLLPDFVQVLREELRQRRGTLVLVRRDAEHDYHIVLAQESTLGGAAAAVLVLDRECSVIASVVRSGRFTGKGALNPAAKELAKKIAILKGITGPSSGCTSTGEGDTRGAGREPHTRSASGRCERSVTPQISCLEGCRLRTCVPGAGRGPVKPSGGLASRSPGRRS